MRRTDVILGIVVAIVGAAAFIIAWQLPFYANQVPGPGFLPLIVSTGLIILGAVLAIQGFRPGGPEVRAIGSVSPHEHTTHGKLGPRETNAPYIPRKTIAVFAGYLVAVPLLPVFGFVVTGAVLMAWLLLGVEKRRGLTSWVALIVTPIVLYFLFVRLLGIALPVGMFHTGILGI
ncbi:tripartite tricarboxylate transporter TctB family protein [Paramixta manurensis]